MVRRVAVVGAGSAGLACIKTCVDEGLEPVCFESSDDIGGLWKFKETPEPQRSSIYRSLMANTSKEMMCFSDFPMPADYPNYMHNSQLLQYFRLYAEYFDLLRYINFQTTVRSITKRPDFHLSGQWAIVAINRDGEEESHIFDAVLVCSGHYTQPTLPLSDFSGYETFSGRCFHSWEYKDANACRGKRVVVVGIGNSGGDIAVEISRSAEKTFLSTRQGAWVMGRMSSNGLPLDMKITRLNNLLIQHLPKTLVNWAAERALNSKYDHKLYGLKPRHRLLDRKPLINDDLPGRILHGALVMKSNLKGFKDSCVVFDDGTVEENIDVVIFCTGYNGHFPFLHSALSEGPHGELMLYKRLFPPSLQRYTLAIMGLFQTRGPIMPIVEMQARWAVKVFLGLCHLPSKDKMLANIESEKKRNMESYPCPRQAALQVAYIPYLDFMAKEVGVRPNFLTLLLRDPVLWAKVFFGPCTPYQYRLTGPGQWAGARHAILTQWERVAQPFRTRVVPETKTVPSVLFSSWLLTFGGTLAIAGIALLLTKSEIIPGLQGVAQIVDKSKVCLRDTWFSGQQMLYM
ncbi:dimethylaniline monooxygenase [N-oxide-forming] 2-like [Channa argus]|uniref:dimethylaniline monooxygenase [N-oxide-forming] 2-like n=1 Tax=Channa argus TaxID=215402 RepID=UPI00294868A6|nr:hypothetical protein Q8A73_008713 [Channa argus]